MENNKLLNEKFICPRIPQASLEELLEDEVCKIVMTKFNIKPEEIKNLMANIKLAA